MTPLPASQRPQGLMAAFDRLLPPFTEGTRERPRDILYIASDRPPWSVTAAAGLQQALGAVMLTIYTVVAGQGIGLEGAILADFVALSILVMGAGTLLHALTTRVSAGHLLVVLPGPLIMAIFIAVYQAGGPGAVVVGPLVSGFVILISGRLLPLLRVLFPAEVSGVLLILLGLSLVPSGIDRFFGLGDGIGHAVQAETVLIAAATLGTITALTIWSQGPARTLALLLGVTAGLLAAILTGHWGAEDLARLAPVPWVSLPGSQYRAPPPTLALAALLPYVLVGLMVAVSAVGSAIVIDKMNDANWNRPDLPMIGRLLHGLGLCHLLNAMTGTPTVAISSVNLGLAHATGILARRVGILTGLFIALLAFLPTVTTFLTLLPRPVIGAFLVYTASYLLVAGAELILSRLLNQRRRATVGLALVAGAAVEMVPDLTAALPPVLEPVLGSALMVGVGCAMLLNLLFRFGIVRTATCLLEGPQAAEQARRLLEDSGADWGARRDVVARATLSIDEVLGILRHEQALTGPGRLVLDYDDSALSVTVRYPGRALRLDSAAPVDVRALLEEDQDETRLDDAMAGIAGALVRRLADRVKARAISGGGELRLEFNQ
jgi:xanthine/uracil permease